MPIVVNSPTRLVTQQEFHALAGEVLRIVFDLHNEYGRLLEEALFKRLIVTRCISAGIGPVVPEVRLQLTHRDFTKDYFVDLLLSRGVPIEAKAAQAIAPQHRAQTLNYLLILQLHHALLLNIRPNRVQHEFVSTSLDHATRRRFRVTLRHWQQVDNQSRELKLVLIDLLKDWGAFLEVSLYRDAVIHFLGGAAAVCRPVTVFNGTTAMGTQIAFLLNENVAFACTALTHGWEQMREHQRRFLAHTDLHAIQWVNLNHAEIEFTTLFRER